MRNKEKGQSLIEVVVALSVATVIITSLLIVVINSLKNARFAQSQVKATKYATEGLERVRTIRDRDSQIQFNYNGAVADQFSDLWTFSLNSTCGSDGSSEVSGCVFTLDSDSELVKTNLDTDAQDLGDGLTRQIIIDDSGTGFGLEKIVSVKVKWSDASGPHESFLQTVITKI